MAGLLEPYRVLDLTTGGAGLLAQGLGDLGADVILVEPPGGSPTRGEGPFWHDQPGPGRSLAFWAWNRNKRSVVLDLDSAEGRDQLRRLAVTADFLVESFPPGYMDERGLGYDALAAINPRLVMVSLSAFGQDGPKAAWAATDLTAMASSGAMRITGDRDRPPVRVSIPQAYIHAALEGLAAALVAHTARERDGAGQHVDVSAQASAMLTTQNTILTAGWGEEPGERIAGGAKLGPLYLQFVYPCKDGHVSVTFLFGPVIGPFTRRLMDWMYDEGFVDDATRSKDWVGYVPLLTSGEEPLSELMRCTHAIEAFTKTKTKAELFAEAMGRGLLIVPVSTSRDVRESEQLNARGFWIEVPHPELGEAITYPGAWAKVSSEPLTVRRRPPLPGEHTEEILRDLPPLPARPAAINAPGELARPALEGLKVLDFTWVIVGPFGTRILADYGATVVRIESVARIDPVRGYQPFKDGIAGVERSAQHANANVNKLGFSLNMSTPEGRELAWKLVRWADVVVENFAPGAMRNWGMDYEALRAVNPGIIMVSTCLSGQDGPQASLAGFGTMGAALSGFHEVTGWPDRAPAGPFLAYTDYIAPRYMVAGILAALDHRRRTGNGTCIDISQQEAAVPLIGPALLEYTVNGRVMSRQGNRSPEHAPHGVYPAAGDDQWAAIACETGRQWEALCQAAGHPGWAGDPRFATFEARKANEDALDATIGAWTASLTAGELEDLLQAAGVPVHRVSGSDDAFADPQLIHRKHFVTTNNPEIGPIPVEASRFRLSRTPAEVHWPGPPLGQHNERVLRDILGMSEDELVEVIATGCLE